MPHREVKVSNEQVVNATEEESRALAEASRSSWSGRSFLREIFLGALHVDWIAPWRETELSEAYRAFERRFIELLERVDSAELEEMGRYPDWLLDALRTMGAFGLKIDPAYGGLGLNQAEYGRICEIAAAYDGNIAALLSAHNSIGVPQPVTLFGTEEQKQRFLPRCAKGAISAFALTEPDVGSDPARLATVATPTEDGKHVRIRGEKLWITNGLIAELMVVMARDAERSTIDAYVVEMDSPGIRLGHHCRFMGLKALANGVIHFDDVLVPIENRLGAPGQGLKIALVTLNTGRLSLPAACVGSSRKALEWAREFAASRVQWGAPVGHHEAIAHKLADLAATTFAMESWSRLASELSMREGYDIRLEAAAAKEWASTRGWTIIDEALQIRGGRGYENERSLQARGEAPYPMERLMRDSRINRIFEGSSEIMHLFMAREMVDRHLQVAGKMLERRATLGERLSALPGIVAHYARWYPKLWWGLPTFFRYGEYGRLGGHLRYAECASCRLAREVFHGMVRYQAGLERKQAWLFRTVDIAMEIAVLCATVVRAHAAWRASHPDASRIVDLADLHGKNARRVIEDRFRALWDNDDPEKYALGRSVCDGAHRWVEAGFSTSVVEERPPSEPDSAASTSTSSGPEPDSAASTSTSSGPEPDSAASTSTSSGPEPDSTASTSTSSGPEPDSAASTSTSSGPEPDSTASTSTPSEPDSAASTSTPSGPETATSDEEEDTDETDRAAGEALASRPPVGGAPS